MALTTVSADEIQVPDLPPRALWIDYPPRRALLLALGRLRRASVDVGVLLPGGLLVLIFGFCFLGPWLFNEPGPNIGALQHYLLPFGATGHVFGTDSLGNDMVSRIMYGGRVSIEVGLGATTIGMIVGSTLGMIAGYRGGVIESLIMRLLDVALAFPGLILALAVATYLGPSERNVIFAISFFTTPAYARLARSQTLRIRHLDFIVASRLSGSSSRSVIKEHVFRNVLPALLTFAMLTVGGAMLAEAGLSYLGLGVRPPQPSWGNLITSGQTYMQERPALLVLPAGFLFLTVVSLNLLGDGLRRRFALER